MWIYCTMSQCRVSRCLFADSLESYSAPFSLFIIFIATFQSQQENAVSPNIAHDRWMWLDESYAHFDIDVSKELRLLVRNQPEESKNPPFPVGLMIETSHPQHRIVGLICRFRILIDPYRSLYSDQPMMEFFTIFPSSNPWFINTPARLGFRHWPRLLQHFLAAGNGPGTWIWARESGESYKVGLRKLILLVRYKWPKADG